VVLLTHGTLQAAVALADGTLRSRRAIDAQVRSLTTGFVEPSLALLDEALSDVSLTRADLACAVIGLPMPLVRGRGLAIPNPSLAPLPGWVRTVPSIELSDRLGVPVLAENDANLGALGEGHFGAAAEMTSFIYIKLVQGIGAGIVIDGRLHRGAGGLAGELSHLHVDDDGPMCGCGGRGCLIMGLHTPHLVDLILPLHPEALDMADLLTLVGEGDVGVCRVLRDLGKVIGRSLADFCVYVDPEGIIVDGLLEGAADPVIDGIRQMLHQCAPPVIASRVRIARGRLGSQAELLGATVLARQYLEGEDARSDDMAALASAP
jgi:predicted NBD/HSP70 family sugar kinase